MRPKDLCIVLLLLFIRSALRQPEEAGMEPLKFVMKRASASKRTVNKKQSPSTHDLVLCSNAAAISCTRSIVIPCLCSIDNG